MRVGSSTGFLQEKVDHLEICLDVAGTHEGQGRGRSRRGRSEDASFLGLREREETTSARLRRLLGQPQAVLAPLGHGWTTHAPDQHHCPISSVFVSASHAARYVVCQGVLPSHLGRQFACRPSWIHGVAASTNRSGLRL